MAQTKGPVDTAVSGDDGASAASDADYIHVEQVDIEYQMSDGGRRPRQLFLS